MVINDSHLGDIYIYINLYIHILYIDVIYSWNTYSTVINSGLNGRMGLNGMYHQQSQQQSDVWAPVSIRG